MKKIKAKSYYFGDMFFSTFYDSLEEEFEDTVAEKAREYGIEFENVTCVESPPFGESYSILFFDWGGMSIGNSMLNSFCRQIIEEAGDRPSVDYVMTSRMTTDAMKDALKYYAEVDKVPNIYLTVDQYLEKLKHE